jgi:hypothetical protein
MNRTQDDFLDILDHFYAQVTDSGAILFAGCHDAARAAARDILSAADLRYIAGHKVTELMANIVNLAASISAEGWLSDKQAMVNFRECTRLGSPLTAQFLTAAAMEKARYEPIMLTQAAQTPLAERNALLRIRLTRMLQARQAYAPLPDAYLHILQAATERVLNASCFATYRPGPLLQFVDEMIQLADQIHAQPFDMLQGCAALSDALKEEGRLWKLFRFKATRFQAKPSDPLHQNNFPSVRAQMLFIPDKVGRPTLH